MIAAKWKTSRVVLLATLLLFAQTASAETTGTPFPKSSEGFQPKVTYGVSGDQMWVKVIAALNNNNIPIVSASKETNQITTDYIVGPGERNFIVGGLISQYKFVISVVSATPSQTRVNVNPVVEARWNGGPKPDNVWHNSTKDNPEVVSNMRNWLYEQIERSM